MHGYRQATERNGQPEARHRRGDRRLLSRRGLLRGGVGLAATVAGARAWPALLAEADHADAVRVADGYDWDLLLRWGDPLFDGVEPLDARAVARGGLLALEPAAAARQFGYNCDDLQFFPLPGEAASGLVCVNNEYPSYELMLPEIDRGKGLVDSAALARFIGRHPQVVPLAQAMLGVSVALLERDARGRWRHRPGSRWARRITAATPMELTGPARGHGLLRSATDGSGTRVTGTFGNCAAGQTPWGTFLSAEENVNEYFGNAAAVDSAAPALREAYRRFAGWQHSLYGWEHADARFDLASDPAELLRFGWIVEVDPGDPASLPKKRTALGRFQHEGATCATARDGRLAVYMGDDHRFEYVYKYVSRGRIGDAGARERLLDDGVLHVARFDADGSGRWLPLVQGRGPLVPARGFHDQGDVVLKTRAAADLVGATPMDRPEDIAVDAGAGRAWLSLTKNPWRRGTASRGVYNGRELDLGPNAANPRGPNPWGHLIEIDEQDGDCAATRFRWRILAQGGEAVAGSAFGSPDNLALDRSGNLWIVTDGEQPGGGPNGCFVMPTHGSSRGVARQVMSAPPGAEVCGCAFLPGDRALLLSVQHPGEGGLLSSPLSAWPDGPGHAPRPSVIALYRKDGGSL